MPSDTFSFNRAMLVRNPAELFCIIDTTKTRVVDSEGMHDRNSPVESNRESPRNGSHIVIGYNAGFSMQPRSQ